MSENGPISALLAFCETVPSTIAGNVLGVAFYYATDEMVPSVEIKDRIKSFLTQPHSTPVGRSLRLIAALDFAIVVQQRLAPDLEGRRRLFAKMMPEAEAGALSAPLEVAHLAKIGPTWARLRAGPLSQQALLDFADTNPRAGPA